FEIACDDDRGRSLSHGVGDEGVDLGPCSNVDALRGLVEEQYLRLASHPARKNAFLLIASGQSVQRLSLGMRLDRERGDRLPCVGRLRAMSEPEPAPILHDLSGG